MTNDNSRILGYGYCMKNPGILLVDDDESVLFTISEWLVKYGYQVFTAETIAGALRIFREEHDRIHLLMTDIKLRNERGFDLADMLEKEYGFVHHLYFTSFIWEEEIIEQLLRRGKPYFEKPLKFKKEILPFLERFFQEDVHDS